MASPRQSLSTNPFPLRVKLAIETIEMFRMPFMMVRHGRPGLSPREGALYLAAVDVVRLYMTEEHGFADARRTEAVADRPTKPNATRVAKRGSGGRAPDSNDELDAMMRTIETTRDRARLAKLRDQREQRGSRPDDASGNASPRNHADGAGPGPNPGGDGTRPNDRADDGTPGNDSHDDGSEGPLQG